MVAANFPCNWDDIPEAFSAYRTVHIRSFEVVPELTCRSQSKRKVGEGQWKLSLIWTSAMKSCSRPKLRNTRFQSNSIATLGHRWDALAYRCHGSACSYQTFHLLEASVRRTYPVQWSSTLKTGVCEDSLRIWSWKCNKPAYQKPDINKHALALSRKTHVRSVSMVQYGMSGDLDTLDVESKALLAEAFASDPAWASKVGFPARSFGSSKGDNASLWAYCIS